ncbi:Ryanodine receptor 3 [Liparis tanakae]|uniref:Ryanodine receptor 3 n=1 Tax=Liparis tanakae TaxID=230148 RepID=A0A4Z2H4W3_9TELE|nr:Ryanodine receptor 3 [Liparis tanakae]
MNPTAAGKKLLYTKEEEQALSLLCRLSLAVEGCGPDMPTPIGSSEVHRKDDEVVLQCVATVLKEHRKFCLAVEGLGNRVCYLEPTSEAKYVPPDLCVCTFVLEQALSVRALQEMLAKSGQNSEGMCLCSTVQRCRLALFGETLRWESCWWTIHPASKQRSEGEKVRIGDDLILVSVSTERYLVGEVQYLQCYRFVHSTMSQVHRGVVVFLGDCAPHVAEMIYSGFLTGGHVMRLCHGHDESLTIPEADKSEQEHRIVNYETGKGASKARSLWRLEPLRISWSGSHIRWGQAFRLRHLATGHYLALTEDRGLVLEDRLKCDTKSTAFCFRASKEKGDSGPKRDIDGMGVPEIKYGDSVCFVMHVATGLWLSYLAPDAKSSRLGPLKRRACLHSEGHMDDGLILQRCQHEESRAARIIRNTTILFTNFIK